VKRVKVTYVGSEVYGSTDPADGHRSIVLACDESAYVSEEKAAQLQEDFPDWFEFGETAAVAAEPEQAEAKVAEAEPAQAGPATQPEPQHEQASEVEADEPAAEPAAVKPAAAKRAALKK
jgi:hypothetical protein